jgi:hypothetical protein
MLATYGWWPWLGSLLFILIWVAIASRLIASTEANKQKGGTS